jgi:hypothetical protein
MNRTSLSYLLGGLTYEAAAQVHLGKAWQFWREDRLELAVRAIDAAMRAGVPASHLYDFHRMVDAEFATRQQAQRRRLGEHLEVEAPLDLPAELLDRIGSAFASSAERVAVALSLRWGRSILLSLVPEDAFVEFMRARFGYYAERTERHKVCLPPCAWRTGELSRALRHEVAHAGVHELAGDRCPRWLNEGVAVSLEGEPHPVEVRRHRLSRRKGEAPSWEEISGELGSWEVPLGSAISEAAYYRSGAFARYLTGRFGWGRLRQALAWMGEGRSVERAIRKATGTSLGRLWEEWGRDELRQ